MSVFSRANVAESHILSNIAARKLLFSMPSQKKALSSPTSDGFGAWRAILWFLLLGGSLFFWPACLDPYLSPRFFFLSVALLVSILWLWKDLGEQISGRWHFFDLLLLGWYGLNLVSVAWSLSWSEGIFYAQKTLLLFGVYWLIRQAFLRDEQMVRKTLGQITLWITAIVCAILIFQIGEAFSKNGLNNETLYDYTSGVFGNKSLAAEFLFFLLVFNGIFVAPTEKMLRNKGLMAAIFGLILVLMLVLQVRTALMATGVGVGAYCLLRAFLERGFRKIFLQKILPAGMLVFGLLLGLLAWKGQGNLMVERLNPLNYLESATANERRFVWYKTDLLNADHYWLGVGNGAWKFWMPSKNIEGGYRLTEKNVVFTRAHNDYLEIRAEMGIVGAIWFCVLFGVAFLMAAWGLGRRAGTKEVSLLEPAVGLLGYCIIQYFDFPRERIEFQVVLAVLFALLAHGTRSHWTKSGSLFSKKSMAIFLVLMSLGLTINLLIGWERMRGEIHNVRLLDAQERGDWRRVAAESARAENRFYEYTDAAIPLAWHEGVAWFQLGAYEKATSAFERAYRLNPWSFQVINNYASGLVKLQRLSEAVPLFEKALTINPRYDEGKFNLSFVYYQMADYSRSEEWLNRVDTIVGPANDADREKNRAILNRLKDFRKVLQEKRK